MSLMSFGGWTSEVTFEGAVGVLQLKAAGVRK